MTQCYSLCSWHFWRISIWKETYAASIDLEDVSNRVPGKLPNAHASRPKVHPLLIRWTAAALFQRKVVLRYCRWTSEPITVCPGLSQSYPVCTEWQSLNNNLLGREGLSFADDILCTDREQTYRRLPMHCRVNLIIFPLGVTFLMPSSSLQKHQWHGSHWTIKLMIVVRLGGKDVIRTNFMTYVGLKFDRSLLWNILTTKVPKALRAIKVMATANTEHRLLILLFHWVHSSHPHYQPCVDRKTWRWKMKPCELFFWCTRDASSVAMRYLHLIDLPSMNPQKQDLEGACIPL